jgi:excisionase family DNA binding protein
VITRDVEYAEREMTLAEAAERSGLASGTLRVLIHRRRIDARKRGRDWFITLSALRVYLSSRDRRGRRARDPRGRRAE